MLQIILFFLFGLYKGMWRYTGIQDMKNLLKASLVSTGAIVGVLLLTVRFEGYPRSIFPLDFMLTFILAGGMRMGIRLYFGRGDSKGASLLDGKKGREKSKRVLIVGAGDAGEKTLRELKDNPRLNYKPIGFVDDDGSKQGRGDPSVLNCAGRLFGLRRSMMRRIVSVCFR